MNQPSPKGYGGQEDECGRVISVGAGGDRA